MDSYEQEVYKFLTQRENFEAMIKVINQFGSVRDEILNNFWNHVVQSLEARLKVISKEFKIWNPPVKSENRALIIIYKDKWTHSNNAFVGIAWEALFGHSAFGVWCDMDSTHIDSSSLGLALEKIRAKLYYRKGSEWWPIWKYGSYNFSLSNELTNILPDRVDATAGEYAENLIGLLQEVENVIDAEVMNLVNKH